MVTDRASSVTLQSPIRLLVVEDDADDRQKVKAVFESIDLPVEYTFASTYDDAVNLICHRYFDMAVVDLVLHDVPHGARETWEGFWILQELEAGNFHPGIAIIVCTYHSEGEVAVEAFKSFHVADFWDKNSSHEQKRSSLLNALDRLRYFDLACRVVFSPGMTWETLVKDLKLPVSINGRDVESELGHLIPLLFPRAEELLLARMLSGASRAQVMRVIPVYENRRAADVVVKYGPINEIRLELKGWEKIKHFIADYRSTRIDHEGGWVLGRQVAAIKYTLVGADPGRILEFSEYYAAVDADKANDTLRKLFLDTCGLWYRDIRIGSAHSNLEDAYSSYLGFTRDKIETAYRFKYADQSLDQQVSHPSLPRRLPNPVAAYLNKDADFNQAHIRPHAFCLTHGDLHGKNVLVDRASGDPWLIDFGHTGQGHWARDFTLLETAIKFQLMQTTDISRLYELEYALSIPDRLDGDTSLTIQDADLRKAFDCIIGMRKTAATLISPKLDPKLAMLDYYVALFYQTLNYIRRHALIKQRHRKNHVLISAALLYERILIQQRTAL